MINITELDWLSLGELGGEAQCLGKFGAFGHARMMKIVRRVRELHKLT